MTKNAIDLLKNKFGHEKLYPYQEDLLNNARARLDSLVVMPTDSGKSLAYQLAAMTLDGVGIVFSHRLDRILEETDALKARGIAAECVAPDLSFEDLNKVHDAVFRGEIDLLYLPSKRYLHRGYHSFIRALKVGLVVVDDAHCIAELGPDYRQEYVQLKVLRGHFPDVPFFAVSDVATPRVRDEIVRQLGMKKWRLFLGGFDRPNLRYSVITKKRAFPQLLAILREVSERAAVIYSFDAEDAESLAEDLNLAGFHAAAYHDELAAEGRREIGVRFLNDDIRILVTTLSINYVPPRKDVGLVLHYDLPPSLEHYHRQSGVGGLDGLPCRCVLFYSPVDIWRQEYFIKALATPAMKSAAHTRLLHLLHYCVRDTCRRKYLLEYFGETTERENCRGCDICCCS